MGTCVYLDILHTTIAAVDANKNSQEISDSQESNAELKLDRVAEEKLVSFCGHVLKDASDFLSAVKGATNVEIHRVLELRSPIIVKVWYMTFILLILFHEHVHVAQCLSCPSAAHCRVICMRYRFSKLEVSFSEK